MSDDFYIGYETAVPDGARSRVFGAARSALAILAITGLTFSASQSSLPATTFAFGARVEYAGVVRLDPYPALETTSGRLLLVGQGKHDADSYVRGLEGRRVRLLGAPIERDGLRLVEVIPGSLSAEGADLAVHQSPPPTSLGDATLVGEIVDSKCFGGVMNPGEGAVHRDCARACLRGRLPPLFVARTPERREFVFELQSASGGRLSGDVVRATGRPVTLSGTLWRRQDGSLILRTTLPTS